MSESKYLGGCYSYKEKYKLKYECCESCHIDEADGYDSGCEYNSPDGFYSLCCRYIEPTEGVDK